MGCNSFTRSSVPVCYWEYDTHVIVHIDLARWVTSSICGEMTAGWYQTGDASSDLVTMHRPLCKISCKLIQIRHIQRAWQSLFLEGMNFKSTDWLESKVNIKSKVTVNVKMLTVLVRALPLACCDTVKPVQPVCLGLFVLTPCLGENSHVLNKIQAWLTYIYLSYSVISFFSKKTDTSLLNITL